MTTSPLSRGDVVLTKFPFTDLSGSSLRPAIVVSPGSIGQDVVLVAISSVIRNQNVSNDFIIDSSHEEFERTGLRVSSVVRTHKLAAVEVDIITRRLGHLGPQLILELNKKLREVLSL
jgi:mRNA interferase MazF